MPRIAEPSPLTMAGALEHRSRLLEFFATARPQSEWLSIAQHQVSLFGQLAIEHPAAERILGYEAALEWERLVAANLTTARDSEALFQVVKANRLSDHAWITLAELIAVWMYSNSMTRGTELSRRIQMAEQVVLNVQGDA